MIRRPLATVPYGVRVLLIAESTAMATGPVVGVARSVFNEDGEGTRISFDVVHYNGAPLVRDFKPTHWAPLEPTVKVVSAWSSEGVRTGYRTVVNDRPIDIYQNRETAIHAAQVLASALGVKIELEVTT